MSDVPGLAINLATVRQQFDLKAAAEACARHGISWVAPWRDQVAATGIAETRRILDGNGLRVTGLCRGGMFTTDPNAQDDNRRAIDEAVGIGATCLVLVVGGLPRGSRDIVGARRTVEDGLGTLLPYAVANNLPLAIEPLHPVYAPDRACINTLAHANDLCDQLGPDLGIALDAYHVWWDPNLAREIKRAGKRIISYHVCDWLVPTTDFLLDRGMMGDGIIDLRGLRAMVEATGYDGHVDVEIFSANNWWKRDPNEVLRVCLERFRSVV